MDNRSRTFAVLHIAVLLAGATGLFGRFISMGGLPLVWYRIMVAVVTMTAAMFALKRVHRIALKDVLPILGCGFLLAFHWVAFFASIKASNVSVGVVCIATSCFFTLCFQPLLAGKKVRLADVLVSFITILGVVLIVSIDIRYRAGILVGVVSAAID
ncbi:MAG: EamA family transporter [Bacteroidales bacterium]|nr:EamA family transporter [Bacteroidales bacterium]